MGKAQVSSVAAQRAVLLAEDDGRAAELVAGGVDALVGQQQHRAGALDGVLGDADALDEAAALVDQRGDQLGGVDLAAAHLGEVRRPWPSACWASSCRFADRARR